VKFSQGEHGTLLFQLLNKDAKINTHEALLSLPSAGVTEWSKVFGEQKLTNALADS